MRRAVWVHQLSQLSEQTADDLAATLLPRGIDTIYLKAMDGVDWMGQFYSHPLAPASPSQFADVVTTFNLAGLTLIPWVVNRFYAAEAAAHIECGRSAGGLVIDFEYQYKGFWQGTNFEAQGYFEQLRQAVTGGLWIAVAPDPRQVSRDYSATLINGLSAYLPQTYWTDFKQPALAVLQSAQERLSLLGSVEPILPYNATPEDMQAALEWCQAQGCQGVSLWRLGTANAAQLDAFAQRVDGEQEVPNVDDAERKAYQDKIDGLTNALGYVAGDAMRPLTRPTAAKYVKVFVTEARRVADQFGVSHA